MEFIDISKIVNIASGLEEKDAEHVFGVVKPFLSNFTIEHSIEDPREGSSAYSVGGEIIRNISRIETRPKVVIARDQAIAMIRAVGFRAEISKSEYRHHIFVHDVVCIRHFPKMHVEIFLREHEVVFIITHYDPKSGSGIKGKDLGSSITVCHKIYESLFWANGFTRQWYYPDSRHVPNFLGADEECSSNWTALYCLAVEFANKADDGCSMSDLIEVANSFRGLGREKDGNCANVIRESIARKCDAHFDELGGEMSRAYYNFSKVNPQLCWGTLKV